MTTEGKTQDMKVDPKIVEMEARAKEAQGQARALRKQAPNGVLLDPIQSVEQKVLIDRAAKEMGFKGNDDPNGMHFMFGDRDMTDQYPDLGYLPRTVMGNGGTRKQEMCKGDPMWMIPTDIYDGRIKDNAARANKLARQQAKSDLDRSPVASGETLQTARVGTPEAIALAKQEAGV